MKPALAEELADHVLRELLDTDHSRGYKKLYLLGLFIQLVHPLQAHDDAGLRTPSEALDRAARDKAQELAEPK